MTLFQLLLYGALASPIVAVSAAMAQLSCPPMPDKVTQINRDVRSDVEVGVGSLGKLKAGQVGINTDVVAKNLFDKYPNIDRLVVVQMMSATYCEMIRESKALKDSEKLRLWSEFSERAFKFTNPSYNSSPPKPPKTNHNATPERSKQTARDNNEVGTGGQKADIGGNVTQGPCSNLQIGGNQNSQTSNCTLFEDGLQLSDQQRPHLISILSAKPLKVRVTAAMGHDTFPYAWMKLLKEAKWSVPDSVNYLMDDSEPHGVKVVFHGPTGAGNEAIQIQPDSPEGRMLMTLQMVGFKNIRVHRAIDQPEDEIWLIFAEGP